jgi:hypothetical protein
VQFAGEAEGGGADAHDWARADALVWPLTRVREVREQVQQPNAS